MWVNLFLSVLVTDHGYIADSGAVSTLPCTQSFSSCCISVTVRPEQTSNAALPDKNSISQLALSLLGRQYIYFSKDILLYTRQVINSWHHVPEVQPVSKSETTLQTLCSPECFHGMMSMHGYSGQRLSFADIILELSFYAMNWYVLIYISLKFIPKSPIRNKPVSVQMMAWHQSGNEALSEHWANIVL